MLTLYDKWLIDQRAAFAANWLIADPVASYGDDLFLGAGCLIADREEDLGACSLQTLSLFADVPQIAVEALQEPGNGEAVALGRLLRDAKSIYKDLAGNEGRSAALAAHAPRIIIREDVSFKDFLLWAQRASPSARVEQVEEHAWTRELWQELRDALPSDAYQQVDNHLAVIKEENSRLQERIEALNGVHHVVQTIAEAAMHKRGASAWQRLLKDLLSRQFFWPLMVACPALAGAGRLSGLSLPMSGFLSYDCKGKVFFKDGERRFRTFPGETVADTWRGFEGGALRWDIEWHRAFEVGLASAKKLWLGQNGRLSDENRKAVLRECSLVIDLRHANEIVAGFFKTANHLGHYRLTGRSAEAYIGQVALSVMLSTRSSPDGVATGRLEHADGAWRIGSVEGTKKKLQYANSAGIFSRVILPEEDRTARDIQEDVTRLEVSRLVEVNYCPSARSAADALQTNGWRRAHFFRTPAIERSFYRLLFDLANAASESGEQSAGGETPYDYLDVKDRATWRGAIALREEESERLRALSAYLTSTTSTVKYCRRGRVPLSDEVLGRWLAWCDHRIRTGTEQYKGAGLGVLCLRTADRDNDMRLWSAIMELLRVHPRVWQRFKWGELEEAAKTLGSVLNNFSGNPAISANAAPDILIILDDAGLTRTASNRVFEDDFRGQWFYLLNPSRARVPHYLADTLEQCDISRAAVLGNTRIIIIYDEEEGDEKAAECTLDMSRYEEGVKRLSVLRNVFTVQAAVSVLRGARGEFSQHEPSEEVWRSSQEKLDKWCEEGMLFRHRGRYHVKRSIQRELATDPVHNDPTVHWAAARALAPFIEPDRLFLATNRDRVFNAEEITEALWHLQEARKYTPHTDYGRRRQIVEAIGVVSFFRNEPDWDTVKLLKASGRVEEAANLAVQLIEKEKAYGKHGPHSSRYALAINTVGRCAGQVKRASRRYEELLDLAEKLLEEGRERVEQVVQTREKEKEEAKLYSEYAFCVRASEAWKRDARYGRALEGLEKEVEKALGRMLARKKLKGVEMPVSREWMGMRIKDKELSSGARARFARCACEVAGASWDWPWVVQVALMGEEFEVRQIARVLNDWGQEYRGTEEEFFKRLANLTRNIRGEWPRMAIWNLKNALRRGKERLYGNAASTARMWIEELNNMESEGGRKRGTPRVRERGRKTVEERRGEIQEEMP